MSDKDAANKVAESTKVASETIGFQTAFAATPQNVLTVAFQQNVHQSVLSADEIAALRAADPAAAELLYRMIEKQQDHDHSIEKETLRSETQYRRLGIIVALLVIGCQLTVAVVALDTNHANIAALFGGGAVLTSLAGVFIRGRGLAAESVSQPNTGRTVGGLAEQQVPTHPPPPPR